MNVVKLIMKCFLISVVNMILYIDWKYGLGGEKYK